VAVFTSAVGVMATENPIRLLSEGTDSILLNFDLPEVRFKKQKADGQIFDVISLPNSAVTCEPGKPQIPICVTLVGIPTTDSSRAVVTQSEYEMLNGYRLFPAQPARIHSEKVEFVFDRDFYIRNAFYPKGLVEIEPLGYIRRQRVARLIISPIQYNPATGQLRIYRRLQIKVDFPKISFSGVSAPARSNEVKPSANLLDSPTYETLFAQSLVNYEQAKGLRKPRTQRQKQYRTSALARTTLKLTIEETALYQLTQRQLVNMGVDVADIAPKTFKLYSEGSELRIYVHGEEDGRFDETDYIVFYGKTIRNKFTNSNVYWLSWGGERGLRADIKDGKPKTTDAQVPVAFKTVEHFEEDYTHDELVMVKSELADHFFWTTFTGGHPESKLRNFQFTLPNVAKGLEAEALFRFKFQGISYERDELHKASVIFRSQRILRAEFKGQTAPIVTGTFPQRLLDTKNWVAVACYDKPHSTDGLNAPVDRCDFMLDWYELEYWHNFNCEYGRRLEFSTDTFPESIGATRYEIEGFRRPEIHAYQINDADIAAKIVGCDVNKVENNYTLVMEDDIASPSRYYVVQPSYYAKVKQRAIDLPSNLRNPGHKVDYIIISHKDFINEVVPLAEFREKQGLDVLIVDVEDVYDEFSNGVFNPMAIKSFLRYAYQNWAKEPTYVLLVGDAHYDYKNSFAEYYKISYGRKYNIYPIFVPTYHSWTTKSGETALDEQFVTVSGDDTLPDMCIGRLPVQTPEEARDAIAKIISYETSRSEGEWRCRIMQVADDADDNVGDDEFERSREELFNNFIPVSYETRKIYLDKIGSPSLTRKMIVDNINEGAIFLEYAGHGGVGNWADQNIFRNDDIQNLSNEDKYPFVIATTCYHGYFDKPQEFGKRVLGEEFLLAKNKGAIAVLNATRLTYAVANSSFDRDIYTQLFKMKPPILGLIILKSKIDFMTKNIEPWAPGVEQYTLFADPATILALPELEIVTELEAESLGTETQLVIKHNIVKSENPPFPPFGKGGQGGFNADMKVFVTYPNNLDTSPDNDVDIQEHTVSIWQGEFGDIRLDIPPNIIAGEGRIRLFAEANGLSAVGGAKFSMYNPVILSLQHELTDTTLLVFAELTDNKNDIREVFCSWINNKDFGEPRRTDMIQTPSINGGGTKGDWYELKEPLPLPRGGYAIKYQIIVEDGEGNKVESESVSVEVPIEHNLAVSQHSSAAATQIFYAFSKGIWALSAKIDNNGSKPVNKKISVYFFDGKPDEDQNTIVDENASVLGYANVLPKDWQGGKDVLQIAYPAITLSSPLAPGIHNIFVWIDPELPHFDHDDDTIGQLYEYIELDNKFSKLFHVNDFILGDGDVNAQSLDKAMSIFIPANAAEPTAVSISPAQLADIQQPDVKPVLVSLGNNAYKIEFHSGVKSLAQNAVLRMKFDAIKLRENIQIDLGFAKAYTQEQKRLLEETMQKAIEKLSIYSVNEGVLKRLKSSLATGEYSPETALQGIYVSLPAYQNSQNLTINDIQIDPNLTPPGQWIILCLNDDEYEIYVKRDGEKGSEKLERKGKVGESYEDALMGLKLNIPLMYDELGNGLKFEYGDVFTFATWVNAAGDVVVKNIRNVNDGNGDALIEILEGDVIGRLGNWLMFFTNSETYELRDEQNQILQHTYGSPIIGYVNESVSFSELGIRITANAGDKPFQFGDKIKFRTTSAQAVESQIDKLGTFALMENNDTTPPTVSLWINGEHLEHGSTIPPRPEISILVHDKNGLDLDTLKFEVSKDEGEFQAIEGSLVSPQSSEPPGDCELRYKLFSITINYKPVLFIGKYVYRVSVFDLNLNPIKMGGGEYAEFFFSVWEQPDVIPPDIQIQLNGEPFLDGSVIEKQPIFNISITDEGGLNPEDTVLLFSRAGDELEPVKRGRYKFDFNPNHPAIANIIYAPDLENGEYLIQVEAMDTSKNKSYLDEKPLRFTLDESVTIKDITNAPNPFEKNTVFTYVLSQEPDDVTIKIYVLSGRLIRTIQHASSNRNYNEQYWDGRDENGNPLANGVYLYKIIVKVEGKKIEKYSKLVILR